MTSEYTAVLKQDGDWWIGWIEEVPGVNCQVRDRTNLVASLREVPAEAIEFNRQDALTAAGVELAGIVRKIASKQIAGRTQAYPNEFTSAYQAREPSCANGCSLA
jgi:hypothetical protein